MPAAAYHAGRRRRHDALRLPEGRARAGEHPAHAGRSAGAAQRARARERPRVAGTDNSRDARRTVIVVDASAVLEVLLRTAGAGAVEERLFASGERLHAPHLLDLEVTHVIRRHRLRGEIAERRASQAVDLLGALPIRRHEHRPLLNRIWGLHQNLTAYDAAYIALAEALDAPLVTRDAHLTSVPGHRARIELV